MTPLVREGYRWIPGSPSETTPEMPRNTHHHQPTGGDMTNRQGIARGRKLFAPTHNIRISDGTKLQECFTDYIGLALAMRVT